METAEHQRTGNNVVEFIPIREHLHENEIFINHPDCQDSLFQCIDFYKKVGFNPPWICYYVSIDNHLVGSAAFKGKPEFGKVEIAYRTFPAMQNRGIGTDICTQLVMLSQMTDPSVIITARTFLQENYSTKVLRNNSFECIGTVIDKEDGEVWEWVYTPGTK